MNHNWTFNIDVGGTFTDCVAFSPEGAIHTCKFLSSGVIKGKVSQVLSKNAFIVKEIVNYPKAFFKDYYIRFFTVDGFIETKILEFMAEESSFFLKEEFFDLKEGTNFEIFSKEEAPILCIRYILKLTLADDIGKITLKLGTTKGTNALLERKGEKVALLVTQGFKDVFEIGTQARPKLFELNIVKPELLYSEVVELEERISSQGTILKPLDKKVVSDKLKKLKEQGFKSIAVCLVNAYKNQEHELLVLELAEKFDFKHISISTKLTNTIKYLNRGDTTIIDAYLSPIIADYLQSIKNSIPQAELKLMTSAGSLTNINTFSGKDCILSGPAGGVQGFSKIAKKLGDNKTIGFDMGGTSTDVSRFDNKYEYDYVTEKAGVRIVAPMYAIETVAAGGGSICWFDGKKLNVGPHSAGADPGPACYGKGGALTITDINLFMGKIEPSKFPFKLNFDLVISKLEALQAEIAKAGLDSLTLEDIAEGFIKIADFKMMSAIKKISSAKGYNPSEYALVSFGGAGSQHACNIAELLGIKKIIIPLFSGILSAYGIGLSDIKKFSEKTVLLEFNESNLAEIDNLANKMLLELKEKLLLENVELSKMQVIKSLDLRYKGQEPYINVVETETESYTSIFEKLHQQLYGYIHKNRALEIVNLRLEVLVETSQNNLESYPKIDYYPQPDLFKEVIFNSEKKATPLYEKEKLKAGAIIKGPAMITEAFSTIIVNNNWVAEINEYLDIVLKYQDLSIKKESLSATLNPITLELFNNIFTSIAEQMGIVLQKTALSTNVKERLDFSCALLDAEGDLIVNAPHIPVHLGAMSESVKALLKKVKEIKKGEVYLSNDPNLGGSHLPDVTTISPVFIQDELVFFTASRAHHAELGGVSPGSAYPFAKNLQEEGVIFRNLKVVENGILLEEDLLKALTICKYPSRNPKENVSDIIAQISANKVGEKELLKLIENHSLPVVKAYMSYLKDYVEAKTRSFISKLPKDTYFFEDSLDDGSKIVLKITKMKDELSMDFSGSAPVNKNSLNANKSIVQSCIIYCLRCLLKEEIPLNSGILRPIKLILPEGMLNPTFSEEEEKCPAVFSGNVEISQLLVEVIFGALGVLSGNQGTMNNLIFGNKNFGYYETICGGTGAGDGFHGASAVHSSMTNTRITDVETIEKNFPVRIQAFEINRNSGGKGKFNGGDGIIRKIEFLEALEVSLITQRRIKAPFGLNGGSSGSKGENILYQNNKKLILNSLEQLQVNKNDVLEIRTPSGGGFGEI